MILSGITTKNPVHNNKKKLQISKLKLTAIMIVFFLQEKNNAKTCCSFILNTKICTETCGNGKKVAQS